MAKICRADRWLVVLVLAGCAANRTDIAGFKDPKFAGPPPRKLAVLASGADLVWRKQMEEALVAALAKEGIAAKSVFVIAPALPGLGAQRDETLRTQGFDSLITVDLVEEGGRNWKPWMKTRTQVLSLASGQPVWTSDAKTVSNAMANFDDVRRSFAEEIVADLVRQGVVAR